MLQHKQQERKLKRIEGDIVKKQRFLRQVMLNNNDGKVCLLEFLQSSFFEASNISVSLF